MRQCAVQSKGLVRWGKTGLAGLLASLGLLAGAAVAQDTLPALPVDFANGADGLQHGQFIWTPGAAPAGDMVIYVDLSRQLAAVYRDGVRIGLTTISSGRAGHETPTGVFTILQKDPNHHSNRYDNAPMPFQERLTWDGVALHAGGVPGYPESHGCVHLPYGFAKALFKETRMGTMVVMEGDATDYGKAPALSPTDVQVASATPVPAPVDAPMASPPEASSERPTTLVANRRD